MLRVGDATDIFVFVHGWRNRPEKASATARRLFSALWRASRGHADRYPGLDPFRPYFVAVRWDSWSGPFMRGYLRVRDRAHRMTTEGHAAHVLGALLGTLDAERRPPRGPATLRTAGGQYLHLVGHSFGCRLLGEAIRYAADPPAGPALEWPWGSRHPFTVDTFVGLQMAARPDMFATRFADLVTGEAPIRGPVVLTVSPHDRALSRWHRLAEDGWRGIGAVGATGAPTIRLRGPDEPYTTGEFARLTNVDAGGLFRRGRLLPPGAHSDIWYPETVHLLLSLADLRR